MIAKNSTRLNNHPHIKKPSSKFRSDINALRALAISGVLFFHFKVGWLKGGFAGVDVFFVISGYLMSKIVVSAIKRGEFSYWDYLSKRIKRIVPALLSLVLTVSLVGFFLYFPEDFKLNQKNAAASVLFLSNILYWQNSGYFDPSSDTNIFLHTWSLSVEWQFYLLYPLFLVLLNRIVNKKIYVFHFVSMTFVLVVGSMIFTVIDPTASFYLLPTRAWEMLFGGIAFFSEGLISNERVRKVLAALGYGAILGCFLFLDEALPWPGPYTAIPVVATFLVIVANHDGFKAVNHYSIQFIGKISYSLYLWHWPIYVVGQYYGVGINMGAVLLFTLTSFVMGYLSYLYIESGNFRSSGTIAVGGVSLFVATAFLSYMDTNHFLFKDTTLAIQNYKKTHKKEQIKQFNREECHISKIEDFNKDQCLCLVEGKKNILMIGDSHMAQLSQSLKEELADDNINLMQATASATLPTLKSYEGKKIELRKLMDYTFLDFIPKNAKKIDGVIVSAHWARNSKTNPNNLLLGLEEIMEYLKQYEVKYIIIGQTESYRMPYTMIAARDFEQGTQQAPNYLDKYPFQVDEYLSKNIGPNYVKVINTTHFPPLSSAGVPYMYDEDHVTKYGADLLVEKIMQNTVAQEFFY
ncbi:acyltransferase [Rufibacter immobilis]|uniref:Acyltransferase n=1 Tax=Rufibacter immobilis TaxID=1348778 RepID=A0A3M9MW24_9BACT|nr:acyltransferase family protein [Rufibacter immobilis]RNI29761.1 acyltransferase [Rufibacter immobilis]